MFGHPRRPAIAIALAAFGLIGGCAVSPPQDGSGSDRVSASTVITATSKRQTPARVAPAATAAGGLAAPLPVRENRETRVISETRAADKGVRAAESQKAPAKPELGAKSMAQQAATSRAQRLADVKAQQQAKARAQQLARAQAQQQAKAQAQQLARAQAQRLAESRAEQAALAQAQALARLQAQREARAAAATSLQAQREAARVAALDKRGPGVRMTPIDRARAAPATAAARAPLPPLVTPNAPATALTEANAPTRPGVAPYIPMPRPANADDAASGTAAASSPASAPDSGT